MARFAISNSRCFLWKQLFQNRKNNPFYSYTCLPNDLRNEEMFYLKPNNMYLYMDYPIAFVAHKDDFYKNGIDLFPDALWKFECDFINGLEVLSDAGSDTDSKTSHEDLSDTDNKII